MPIIRARHSFDGQFTQIPNSWLRDPRLSLKAKGLIAQLMSHSVGWKVSLRTLAQANSCGVDLIRSAIDELLTHGYLVRSETRERNEAGQLGDYTYQTSEPTLENPTQGKPTQENPHTKNNISLEEQSKEVTHAQRAERECAEIDFDTFWKLYPRKVGKEAARRVFMRLHSRHNDDMIDGVKRLSSDPNLPAVQFIPHAATWLNRAGWDDEPFPERVLSADEKKQKEAQELAERRERDRVRRLEQQKHDRIERERLEADLKANPVARCEHDRILYNCRLCWDLEKGERR